MVDVIESGPNFGPLEGRMDGITGEELLMALKSGAVDLKKPVWVIGMPATKRVEGITIAEDQLGLRVE